jgi:predicted aconitase with swiveling domain
MGLSLGRALVPGTAEGRALVLQEPLSLWGGLDAATGEIVEASHPQRGEMVPGRILVMPAGRGSSSSATILAEAVRAGIGPAGIVLAEPDGILVIGALVARELYGIAVPVVAVDPATYASIDADALVRVDAHQAVARLQIRPSP